MRQVLLAAIGLAVTLLAAPGSAGADVLAYRHGLGWSGPVVVQPYYPAPAYPVAPYVPYAPYLTYPPYYYGSYFRPEAPLAWNAQRNWRDTWEDDGVKVHGYTLR